MGAITQPVVKCKVIEKLQAHHPDIDEDIINRAINFAVEHHGEQTRASGDPYFYHPLEVAEILADARMDQATVITAILHDTVEDTHATLTDIERVFDKEIAQLVDGVTKLTKIEFQSENLKQAENFRKLIVAISEDIRVLVVKLADRLHNMRTLHYIKNPEKRRRIARETMEIYAALAERIGMQKFKDELQDLAFRELYPDAYKSIVNRLEFLRKEDTVVKEIEKEIRSTLEGFGVKAKIAGREKTPYSIWRKMQHKNISFEQLTDIIAFRALVESIEDCYKALGAIHSTYHMLPGRFKDFISTPKANGYKSLHTIVMGPKQHRIEVQIRTFEMHEISELGVAAHWAYKQGTEYNTDGKQYRWIRELLSIVENDPSPDEFLENTKLEMYHDQVFCFTPKGDLVALPRGATPVDFAFAVHTEVGNTCVGAKINGRIVPLRTQLRNGDQVEVICSKSQKPSPTWEKFVVSGKARSEIRRFIRSQQQREYITLGKAILTKAFDEVNQPFSEKILLPVLHTHGKKEINDLYAAVGEGIISKTDIIRALFPDYAEEENRKNKSILSRLRRKQQKDQGKKKTISVPITGLIPGMAIHFAGCCHPLPGEPIVGIVNTGKGVAIHSAECRELENFIETPERWIDVAWEKDSSEDEHHYIGRIKAVLSHERGSLATFANAIAKEEGNIHNLRIMHRSTDFFELIVDVEVRDVSHLADIMGSLRNVHIVQSVERHSGGNVA